MKTVVKTMKEEGKNVERKVQRLETKQKDETEERMKVMREERTKANDEFRKLETKLHSMKATGSWEVSRAASIGCVLGLGACARPPRRAGDARED